MRLDGASGLVFAVLVISTPVSPAISPLAQPAVNAEAAAIKAFTDRASQYGALHRKMASTLPAIDETKDAAKLTPRERALAEAIARARADARVGDIFGDFRPIAIRVIREDWAGRTPADRRALFKELPPKVEFRVNMRYPDGYPLLTMPAKLLSGLPKLPEELEYRLLGRHLILRDTKANIIVDALLNAVPSTS
jgi:hypothetical protein